jgi:Cd2+/Zn2+-exporting ATPase
LGLVTLVLAVAADMGMSLAVTLNAMRLLRGALSDPPAP